MEISIRYGSAVCSTAAGLALRLALAPMLGSSSPYITFFPAVMFASWFGGLRAGIVATVLSLLAALYFAIPPLYDLRPGTLADVVGAVTFIGVSIFVSILNESLRRSRARSEQRLRQLTLEAAIRARAESALSESKLEAERVRDLLQTTFSSIGDAVITTDAHGMVTFLNRVAEELTGWSVQAAAGKAIAEVFAIQNETTRLPAGCPVDQALREEVTVGFTNRTVLIAKDGRAIPIEDSAAPIRDENRGVQGAILVFRDVTGRRKAEDALHYSEERLRLAMDAGKMGVWDWDILTNRIEWSDLAYRIFDVDRGDFPISMDQAFQLLHPADRERISQALGAAIQNGAPYAVEGRNVRRNGEIRWIASFGLVTRNEHGAPARMLGTIVDITERKQAAARLKKSEEQFRTVFANALIGMVVTNLEGHIIQSNAAYSSIVGYSLKELKNITLASLTHPDHMEENRGLLQRLIAGEIPSYVLEKRIRGKSGEFVWVRASATMLHSAEGSPSEVIGLVEDIAGRKRAEEERDSLVRALKRSNEDFETFAHAASHDLRSPLRTIGTMAELLSRQYKGRLDANASDLIGLITSSATRMDSLISDLLEFSKPAQGEPILASVEAGQCLEDALNNLRQAVAESGASIHADSLPLVTAQHTPLVRVFQNLLANAIKYRRSEPIFVGISAERSGARWIIRVKDNGMGFDPKYAEELFQPFRRLHGDEYSGNGIGLASCKRVIEYCGGRIWAESEPGLGSTFSFSLCAAAPNQNGHPQLAGHLSPVR